MPTTTYTATTAAAAVLGARTDAAGAAVVDTTAEEARLLSTILKEGYVKPADSFKVTAQSTPNMTVKVGSGTAKADHYVVAGDVAGQGNYMVRLDVASQNVTITAADASQIRTDEIYLVVRDNAYDSSARVLPQIGYRQGDLGGAAPGPDATWKASVLLARVFVGAAATSITNANILDARGSAGFLTNLGVGAAGGRTDAATLQYPTYLSSMTDVPGVSLDVVVGPSGVAVVSLSAERMSSPTPSATTAVDFSCSGANTRSAGLTTALFIDSLAPLLTTFSKTAVLTGLAPGLTTFKQRFQIVAGSAPAGVRSPSIDIITF